MHAGQPQPFGRAAIIYAALAITVIAVPAAIYWWVYSGSDSPRSVATRAADPVAHAGDPHGEPGHDHHDHDHDADHDANSLRLSPQAQENIALKLDEIKLQDFHRTITVPGMVVERPGETTVHVSAPLTGIVTRIFAIQGEIVSPGAALFELRLTHEELVQAQVEYLRTAEELDVVKREVERLQKLAASGAIPGRSLLEQQYEQQKKEAALRAQRQALLLHDLTSEQVDAIYSRRVLLQQMTVYAPSAAESAKTKTQQVQFIRVVKGQRVADGDMLCTLADYSELYVEGQAFEDDIPKLSLAVQNQWTVSAVFQPTGAEPDVVEKLEILYLANRVDPDSRTFNFFVKLKNRAVRDSTSEGKRRFIDWRYKPGQRVELRIPVERWTNRIVLPVAAVVQEGAESYVFAYHDGHFDRRAVRLEFRDQLWAVIAAGEGIQPGDTVALTGAHQMHLTLKNKLGPAPDPHSGHQH